jgi:hypothetical protein
VYHLFRGIGILTILSNGSKYVDGDLGAKGGEGYGFFGIFSANARGELMTSTVVRSGHYYIYDPEIILYHAGSIIPQNMSVTGIDIVSGVPWSLCPHCANSCFKTLTRTLFKPKKGGHGYIDGDLVPEGGGGKGAYAKFKVDALGQIVSTYFEAPASHGGNFTSDPPVHIFFRSSSFNQVHHSRMYLQTMMGVNVH